MDDLPMLEQPLKYLLKLDYTPHAFHSLTSSKMALFIHPYLAIYQSLANQLIVEVESAMQGVSACKT